MILYIILYIYIFYHIISYYILLYYVIYIYIYMAGIGRPPSGGRRAPGGRAGGYINDI